MQKEFDTLEQMVAVLHDKSHWYHRERDTVFGIISSIQNYDSTYEFEDATNDYILYLGELFEKNKALEQGKKYALPKTKNGLILSLINHLKKKYNTLKRLNVKDKYYKQEVYEENKPKFLNHPAFNFLTFSEKALLAFINGNYILKKKVDLIEVGVNPDMLTIHQKNLSYQPSRVALKLHRPVKIKHFSMLSIKLCSLLDLDGRDKIVLSFLQNSLLRVSIMSYMGLLDVFKRDSFATAEVKVLKLATEFVCDVIVRLEEKYGGES